MILVFNVTVNTLFQLRKINQYIFEPTLCYPSQCIVISANNVAGSLSIVKAAQLAKEVSLDQESYLMRLMMDTTLSDQTIALLDEEHIKTIVTLVDYAFFRRSKNCAHSLNYIFYHFLVFFFLLSPHPFLVTRPPFFFMRPPLQ